MNETQKRIQAYKKALPGMKERVSAVALLLVVSISMMTSATFAWVTLSRTPEITSIATTVATNGNLEIALSDKDGKAPAETTVNDGGQDVTRSNLTWGNLINLSSESYGLDYLTLRPASLNSSNLITSPLYAVEYAEDGRVVGYFTDFSFSNFDANTKAFRVPSTGLDYGVRAVSSVTYKDVEGEAFFKNQMDEINKNAANAKNIFNQIIGNDTYMSTISALVGIHVSVVLDNTDLPCVQHIDNLVSMITDFQASVDAVGQTMVDIINLHLYISLRETNVDANTLGAKYESQKVTLEALKANNFSNSLVNTYKSKIAGLDDYVTLAKKTKIAYDGIKAAKEVHVATGNVYWQANLEAPANQLCNMSTATLNEKTVGQLSQDIMGTATMIFSGKVLPAQLNDGALKDLDVMLGEPTMSVQNMSISVKVPKVYNGTSIPLVGGTTQTIRVNITTAAKNSGTVFVLPGDLRDAEEVLTAAAGTAYKGQAIAADTYAMAIDFWVRTNDANPLLILEGEYQYREDRIPVYGSDASGQAVPLYSYTTTVSGEEVSFDVYKVVTLDENSNEVTTWYYADDHTELTAEQLNGATPTAQEEIIRTVIGYEGVNRVWDELDDPNSNASQQIYGTSTTQGSGSCYVFYPTTPEDQAQGLKILGAMRVAFADENGALLGEASMDVENAIEDAGRVIVPLKMRPQEPVFVGVDSNGDPITSTDYITRLVQNEAKRITALVYLEGANLSNSDVLAAGSINGQLNIQFGTDYMEMEPIKDAEVMKEYYTFEWQWPTDVAASDVKATDSGYEIYYDSFTEESESLELKLLIAGAEPTSVKGNFISYISSTQGAREDVFTMRKNADGFWEAYTYEEGEDGKEGTWVKGTFFSGPGLYRLRSLQVDGVDIVLPENQRITYEVEGVKITSLTCDGWGPTNTDATYSLMTAQDVYPQKMFMTVNTNQGTVPSIQGVFLGDNGKTVTANFTKVGEEYQGTANFASSGNYVLTYVIVDGVYTQLDPELYKTLSIRVGLRANIVVNQPMNEECVNLRDAMADDVLTGEEKNLLATYPALSSIAAGDDVLDDEEKKLAQEQLTTLLNLLHYGTGVEGDENEKGLSLQQTNGNWFITNDGSQELFMDVSCAITDDLGNELKNLGNVELFYTAGSETNTLTAGLKDGTQGIQWNPSTGRYEGTFKLSTSSLGVYRFDKLTINGVKNTVTAASAAPTITSIAPTPMSVVQVDGFENLVSDLSGSTKRTMSLVLRDAAAAQMNVHLSYGLGESAQAVTVPVTGYSSEKKVGGNHVEYTFEIPLTSDGYWKLESVDIWNVFYGSEFYTGDAETQSWLTLTAADLIKGGEENADIYFLTQVTMEAAGLPQSSSNEFMENNQYNGMYIKLTNQGRPLVDVLKELDNDERYDEYNIESNIAVYMTYKWVNKITDWTVDDDSKLPVREFGGQLNMTADGRYTMGPMNFLLDGKYEADFKLTIGSVTFEAPKDLPAGFKLSGSALTLENSVEITWEKPVVKITGATNATKDSLNNPTFTINLGTDSSGDNTPFTGVQNYFENYYANVHISGEKGSYSCPAVTMTMESGVGSASNCHFVIVNNENSSHNRTYSFTANGATDTKDIGHQSTTNLVLVKFYTRDQAGKTTVTNINMDYGDTVYHLPLRNAVTVNQQHYPIYLTLNADLTQVDMPSTISATAYNGKSFTVSTGGASSVNVISPDGRAMTVTLPTLTRVVERYENSDDTVTTYDNESGTAVANYVYYHWTTTSTSGCNTTTTQHYKQYQRYERIATNVGQRYHYEDTCTMSAWSGGTGGTSVPISSTTTFTSGTVNVTPKLVRTEEMRGSETQYCYKPVSGKADMSAMNPSGTSYENESLIVTTWTPVS